MTIPLEGLIPANFKSYKEDTILKAVVLLF